MLACFIDAYSVSYIQYAVSKVAHGSEIRVWGNKGETTEHGNTKHGGLFRTDL